MASAAQARAAKSRARAAQTAVAAAAGALGRAGTERRIARDFGRTGNSSQKLATRQASAWASAHWKRSAYRTLLRSTKRPFRPSSTVEAMTFDRSTHSLASR